MEVIETERGERWLVERKGLLAYMECERDPKAKAGGREQKREGREGFVEESE